MSAMISEGWAFIKSEEICEKVQSGSTPRNSPFTATGDIPFLKVYNIVGQKINFKYKPQFISREIQNGAISRSKVIENDVLMNIVGPPLGKIAIVTSEYPEWNINQAITLFRANPDFLDYRFLFYFLNEGSVIRSIHGDLKGSVGQVNISLTQCRNFMIPTPPLAEQKVIADKLDELLAQVESTKARLDAIPVILKSFRQSVLAAAVSGKLTEEWRGANESSPISQLLEKVDQRRLDKRSEKFASKPFRPDEVTLEIPEGWEWVRLARIAEVVSGVAKGSKSKDELIELSYLRVANVQRGYLDLDEIKQIRVSANKAENLYLKKGDILFNEGGDIDKLGRGWIWEEQVKNCIHQNHVFRARSYSQSIQSKYISHYGNSEGKEYFLREGTQSVNLANINKTTLSLLPIPLPPVEEQAEIVSRVEELFALADKVEVQVNVAQTRVNNLTRSILAKAFKGELTAEWRAANPDLISGDNSAKALLERIKAERVKLSTKKSKSRKSKTKVITNEG